MDSNAIVIVYIVIAIFLAIIGFIVFVVLKKNRTKPKRRQSLEIPKAGKNTDSKRLCLLLKSILDGP